MEQSLYLNLMKECLCDLIYATEEELELRKHGQDWGKRAHTMIGLDRLNNIQFCIEDILKNNIPGNLIETGVWRGGASIFMRAVLKNYGINDRMVYVADSFEGLPPPNAEKYPSDKGHNFNLCKELAVSIETVKDNFNRYGLLDDKVKFLKGWFKDTLPTIDADEKFSLIRLDGDLYESTMDSLTNLYPKLSKGGYCIIDDYFFIACCKEAVSDFRAKNNITEQIETIDWTGVYWKK